MPLDIWSFKSPLCSKVWNARWILACLLVLALFLVPAQASFEYDLDGVHYTVPVVQLWYEGYWQKVRIPTAAPPWKDIATKVKFW